MANRKLKSLKFPGIDDTYILDAGNVNYSEEETYEEGSVGEGLNALKEDIKDNYAKNDGYYDGMTVGNAEQIVGTVFEEDDTAYNYRTTGGSAEVGDRAYVDAVVGGSLVWNQLANEESFPSTATKNGITLTNNSDGSWTATGTQESASAAQFRVTDIMDCTAHKYLVYLGNALPNGVYLQVYKNNNAIEVMRFTNKIGDVISMTDAVNCGLYLLVPSSYSSAVNYTFSPQLFDLTAMFGSTIADYIYALETAHAGDGVAWFKRYFPKPYYAYHAVGMEHVNAVSARTVGFNQFDKSTIVEGYIDNEDGELKGVSPYYASDYIPVIPSSAYYIKTGQTQGLWGAWYDANKNFIQGITNYANSTITAPSNAHFARLTIKVGANGDENAFCMSIRWDNSRDGDYEPYNLHTYPLADLTLRGIPKKDESGNLYFDGDRYLPDGTVERRYAEVDMGTLTWVKKQGAEGCFGAVLSVQYKYVNNLNIISEKWQEDSVTANVDNGYYPTTDKLFRYYYQSYAATPAAEFYVKDTAYDSMSATEFKAAMSGVYLIYELATPTTEEADPYQYPMVVDNWGTEELIDGKVESGDRDVAIPVGHETKYPPNLKDKLESAANNPDADGAYILTHDGGSNTYTPLASNPTIQNIIARLEALEGGGENE